MKTAHDSLSPKEKMPLKKPVRAYPAFGLGKNRILVHDPHLWDEDIKLGGKDTVVG